MKILRSRKALSPVVASIILIAVTVAVSIAVAAWMGALTFTFTAVEELTLPTSSEVTWGTKYVQLTVRNTGTSKVSIVDVRINGQSAKNNVTRPEDFKDHGTSIDPATYKTFNITLDWKPGYKYRFEFVTSSNKIFYQDYTAPS